jgi:hypothetical protein
MENCAYWQPKHVTIGLFEATKIIGKTIHLYDLDNITLTCIIYEDVNLGGHLLQL